MVVEFLVSEPVVAASRDAHTKVERRDASIIVARIEGVVHGDLWVLLCTIFEGKFVNGVEECELAGP